jgi:hypothetical protein
MTKTTVLSFFFLVFMSISSLNSFSQGIEQLKNLKDAPKKALEQGIKINGSVASTSNYFDSKLIQIGKIPFESSLRGAINFDFFGKVKMPFTFNLNTQGVNFKHPFDQKFRFRQPFNIMQFRPSYKGIELVLGSGTASFSPLTVNGHRFEGIGINVNNKKIPVQLNFVKGTFLKPIRFDSLQQVVQPSYARKAVGGKVGFQKGTHSAALILFQAKDNAASLTESLDRFGIFPAQNAVIGINIATNINKNIELKIETALSGITTDSRSSVIVTDRGRFSSMLGLLDVNGSTIYKKAINSAFNYKGETYTLGLAYNHVDPDYRTLGAYYFTNDLENITTNFATQLMEGKLSLMGSLGRQRDNLNNDKTQTMGQWVGNANIAYSPSEKLTTALQYSNFTSFTNLRTDLEYLTAIVPYDALDSLNFRQINQNLTFNLVAQLSSDKELQKSLMATVIYQQSDDKQGSATTGSKVVNAQVEYNHSNTAKASNTAAAVMLARNDYLFVKDWLIGPSVSHSAAFLAKQLKSQASLSYLRTWGKSQETSGIANARIALNYTLKKKHTIGLTTLFMHRNVREVEPIDKDFWQFMASISYNYSFELLNTSKKK